MNLAYCEWGWATEKVDGDPWRSSRNIRQHRKSKKHARAMETKDRLCATCQLERIDPVRGSATECEGCHAGRQQHDRPTTHHRHQDHPARAAAAPPPPTSSPTPW